MSDLSNVWMMIGLAMTMAAYSIIANDTEPDKSPSSEHTNE